MAPQNDLYGLFLHLFSHAQNNNPMFLLFLGLSFSVYISTPSLDRQVLKTTKKECLIGTLWLKNGNAPHGSKSLFSKSVTPEFGVLCFVELFLSLLAAGAAPVVGQVFKGYAVVLGRVIHIAAD